MNVSACYLLGYVRKTHGAQGELTLKLDADHPEIILKEESLFILKDGSLIPFFIEDARLRSANEAIVKLDEVDDIEMADALVGSEVFLPLTALPPKTGNGFYFHEIVGFHLYLPDGTLVGTVTEVLDYPGQPKLRIDRDGTEILVPLHHDLVVALNRESRVLVMNLPEGLLEVYLGGD
ncbi:MAG: 16S rRNA processing protein RimM [Flavobacteriales bacterium]|nr:16S rRNA processing protein RimM [Flavobacteriales bacterium]MCB9448763.1 16S rRNA processing protein RimM [Flavobacteriales bacterium]